MNKTVIFPENNIIYSQDFHFCQSIPAGIEFSVEEGEEAYRLVAPGYGDSADYGKGALYVNAELLHAIMDIGEDGRMKRRPRKNAQK